MMRHAMLVLTAAATSAAMMVSVGPAHANITGGSDISIKNSGGSSSISNAPAFVQINGTAGDIGDDFDDFGSIFGFFDDIDSDGNTITVWGFNRIYC